MVRIGSGLIQTFNTVFCWEDPNRMIWLDPISGVRKAQISPGIWINWNLSDGTPYRGTTWGCRIRNHLNLNSGLLLGVSNFKTPPPPILLENPCIRLCTVSIELCYYASCINMRFITIICFELLSPVSLSLCLSLSEYDISYFLLHIDGLNFHKFNIYNIHTFCQSKSQIQICAQI